MKKTYFAPAAVVVSMLVLSATRAGAQGPPNPCCAIVAVDAATGIATAKITADGRVFQFKPKNPAVTTLQPGQPVYANFGKAQVSVDGRTVCCEITSAPQAAMAAAGGRPVQQPAAVPPTISAAPPAAVAPTISAPSPAAPERAPAARGGVCCEIVAVDATTGVVTAKVNANGNLFGFKPGNPASVKPGQAVYVNFTSHQVSLDGRTVCCLMMGDPQPAAVAAATPERVVPVPTATTPSASGPMNSLTVGTRATSASAIDPSRPTISYGTPRLVDAQHPRDVMELRPVTMRMAGRDASTKVLRLRGLAGIEQTQDLPEGAKRLLQIHVRALDPNESHDYIINTALAEQWMASHPPVPADIKASGGSNRETCHGDDYLRKINCDKQAAGDAVKGIQDVAKKEWNHASDELAHDWKMVSGCFADATLPLNGIPVKFAITPNITVPLSSVAMGAGLSLSTGGRDASANVNGSVGLGFPMEGDFVAQLDVFYIPCLPFVVRPKSLGANGTLGVGEKLTASVVASGKFDKTYKIPPTGGSKIPIEIIPIVIAGVPVAEMDVSAYIEGDIEVGGSGKADAHFELSDPHKVHFNFACDGGGCTSGMKPVPNPATVMESAEIKGQVFVKPSVYTALQLDFDYDLLGARAGPQPYLLGMASGCAEASATQSTDGTSTSEENHALMADLDWGVELRAEALVAEQVVGNPWTHKVSGDHIWFRDLAPGGSNALVANVSSVGSAQVARPVSYKVKMPTCYPYTNKVQYRVTWTGGATPGANSLCQWQAAKGAGTCTADPARDLVLNFTWANAGVYSLTVTTTGDDHHRSFSSAPQVTTVTVGAAGGG